jgi:hypothetical protein
VSIAVTIGGVSKSYRVGTFKLMAPANGRSTGSMSIRSNDGTYRPALRAEVIVTENGTRILGGLLQRPSERGILGDNTGNYDAIETAISIADFNSYAELRYVNGTFPGGSLEAFADWLVAGWLTEYGVSVDAGQVTGPAIPELECIYERADDVLNRVCKITAGLGDPFVWKIDHYKSLRLFQPSTQAAPFDITEGDATKHFGDITVEIDGTKYANRVVVKVPTKTEIERVETFTGDGSTTIFTPQYTVNRHYGIVHNSESGNYETLRTPDDPDAATWTLDPADNSLTIGTAPAIGATITFRFDGSYSGEGIAVDAGEIASYGTYEKVIKVDSVPADTTAQAIADGYLAEALLTPKTIKYKTFALGLLPGQSQTITIPLRNISESVVITDIVAQDYGKGDRLLRSITAKSGTAATEGWREVYKIWSGDRMGASVVTNPVANASVSAGGPHGPERSVQTKQLGRFHGDVDFQYDKDTNTLVCGDDFDDSITAAVVANCVVMGLYCEIADPA